jgi:hypothetical protein
MSKKLYVQCDNYYARYLNWGIMSPMAIGWLFLEHAHQHKLWRVI